MLKNLILITLCLVLFNISLSAQTESANLPAATKANKRPTVTSAEPFDKASVETMAKQCVKLETEIGVIELEMFPESAPESVRNFLNLVATKMYDTTKFSRVVPNFVVQGGNISTREIKTPKIIERARRTVIDEPNLIKHERGIVSLARPETPNGATTHFFVVLRDSPHLDGTFAAFGRVTNGMEVIEKINNMPVEGDKPTNPVKLTRAIITPCPAPPKP
jgi:peptidyl-prolyl cis-trans isomerase B (cyclophilin B)